MSKSDDSGKGVVFLSDAPEEATKKIMAATTDSIGKINFDPQNQPGISNLLQILALLQGISVQQVTEKYQGQSNYGDFKKDVAEAMSDFLTSFQNKLSGVNEANLQKKIVDSEVAMNTVANSTLLRVQKAVGLR
jgi:tryptophanyl-tRNA synthetase